MNTITLEQISHQLPKLGRLSVVLLVILLAYICAQLAWKIMGWARAEPLSVEIETPSPTRVVPPAIDYGQQIARLHLFGSATSAANTAVPAQRVAESRLPLLLKGVFAGNSDQIGYAIIQEQGKPQEFYKVGDEISNGVTLKSIYSEYVLVDRNGKIEKISLPRATLNAAPLASTIDLEEDQKAGADLNNIRDELLRSPTKLTEIISISPYTEDDQFIGFRVAPSQDPNLFQELGFMDGDIVTSINGISLDAPNKSINAIEELMEAEEVNLTILRDGTTISLVRNLE